MGNATRRLGFLVLAGFLPLLLPVAEVRAAGLLVPRDGSPPIAVRSHRVAVEVTDGMARTTVRQTFVNPYKRPLEAIYVFPVPEGAALTAVAMETGGRRLEGLLVERQRARKVYDEIVRRKKDPALVEQIGRSLFRLSVFPVIPGEETVVELSWVEHLPLAAGEFRYVYPLATVKGETVTEQDFTLNLTMRSSVPFGEVASSDPGMEIVAKEPGLLVASMERMGAKLDRDVVVTAKVVAQKATVTVSTWRGSVGEGVFLAIVTPPPLSEDQIIPRDVILVLDTSGSMGGEKIEQAKSSALFLLEGLRPTDRVNIIRFSSSTVPFAGEPVPATPENLDRLRRFVGEIEARGSTALGEALQAAVDVPAAEGRVRTVVLLTDGRPTIGTKDPETLVKIAKQGAERKLRMFPFGIGKDVDGGLLRGIAQATGGQAEIFVPGGEVESRLKKFLMRTSAPAIADLTFSVDGLVIHDVLPRPLPDAYFGEQVAICGRYRDGGDQTVTVSATIGGERASLSRTATFRRDPGGPTAARDLFAKTKLGWLEEQLRLRLGLGDDAYYAALDRGAYATSDEIVDEMIEVSLEFGVQCAYTSFLVLLPEDIATLDPKDEAAIAKAMERASQAKDEVAAKAKPAQPEKSPGIEPKGGGEAPAKPAPDEPAPDGGGSGNAGSGDDSRTPAGEPPPADRNPSDPAPGSGSADPGDPGRPPPSPTPPPPASAGGASLGGAVGGGGSSPGAPLAGGKTAVRPPPGAFSLWWARNREEIESLRARTLRGTPTEPTAPETAREVAAALFAATTNRALDPAARTSAVLALARTGGERTRKMLLRLAEAGNPEGLGPDAILALARLPDQGDPQVKTDLLGTLADASRPAGERARAALALGLRRVEGTEAGDTLLAVASSRDADDELAAACLVAAGLLGDEGRVATLADALAAGKLGDRKLGATETAALVVALGRLGRPEALPALERAFRRGGEAVERMLPGALAAILPGAEPEAQRSGALLLARLADSTRDDGARAWAILALGRLGRETAGTEVADRCERLLVQYLRDGKRPADRAAAALALGVMGLEAADGTSKPEELRRRLADRVRAGLDSERSFDDRGAYLIALGLLRDDRKESLDLLVSDLSDPRYREEATAAAATALGLIGGDAARDALAAAVVRGRSGLAVRVEAATALALAGSPSGAGFVFDLIEAEKSRLRPADRLRLAAALGLTGDPGTAKRLAAMLAPDSADGRDPDGLRALAALALGRIAGRGSPDPLARLRRDLPSPAPFPLIEEALR